MADGSGGSFVAQDAAIGAGIIFRTPDGQLLFLQRSGKSDQPHTWCFPGGTPEPGEDADETALREADEETGWGGTDHAISMVDDRDGFTTFLVDVPEPFEPRLNDEHTDHIWSHPDHPPEPLHPGVRATLEGVELPEREPVAQDEAIAIAFDRDSIREIDRDGRLHAAVNNISKANVCPYFGREIPGWQGLGLEPDKIYKLLRSPEELSKPETIKSFNNLPLLSKHVPVTAKTYDGHKPELVVGSLGTDAEWVAPYIRNSLVVWAKDHVEGVQSEDKRELSAAYYYTPDMTPGTYLGVRYDGVMRDICANHTVLCEDGRAGDDVMVGDSMPIQLSAGTVPKQDSKENFMSKTVLTRKAALVQGALHAFLSPLLAQDTRIDVGPLLKGIGPKNYKARKAALAVGLTKLTEGKLAQDAGLEGVHKFLDSLDDLTPSEAEAEPVDKEAAPAAEDDLLDAGEAREGDEVAGDDDPCAQVMALLEDKVPADVLGQIKSILQPPAGDDEEGIAGMDDDNVQPDKEDDGGANPGTTAEDEEEDKEMVTTAAMDAAIKNTEARILKQQKALRAAEAFVRPWVGELVAMDSAEAVYRGALKVLKVDVAGVHASALPAILKMQPLPGERREARITPMGMDSAGVKGFAARYPDAARISSL